MKKPTLEFVTIPELIKELYMNDLLLTFFIEEGNPKALKRLFDERSKLLNRLFEATGKVKK